MTRVSRATRRAQAILIVRERQEFFFQAEVLFTGFSGPAHTGKAVVFRSHRPIFGRIHHDVLPRKFRSPRPAPERRARDTQTGPRQVLRMERPNALRWRFGQLRVCAFLDIKSRGFPSVRPMRQAPTTLEVIGALSGNQPVGEIRVQVIGSGPKPA
jgi:hypothetical protein